MTVVDMPAAATDTLAADAALAQDGEAEKYPSFLQLPLPFSFLSQSFDIFSAFVPTSWN
jgi:hypothetical protein